MKKLFNFRLLVLIGVLITSLTTQVWAYYGIQLRSDYYTGGWEWTSDVFDYGGDGQKYWDVYHTGYDSYWRIKIGGDDYGPTGDSNFTQNVGYAGYKVGKQSSKSFRTSDNAGILRICTNQKSGGEYSPYVWVERPGVVFKHNWDGGDWTEVNATDNRNGTYTYTGIYSGTPYFNAKSVNGASKVAKSDTRTYGSPVRGNRCEFKWEPTGYKLTGDEETNRGVFTITKYDTITFNANGGSGTLPGVQEALYGSTVTLNGSANLKKTGYRFVGWNTQTDGNGTNYATNGSITLSGNITLYAKWEAADAWYIKGTKKSGDSQVDDDIFNKWNNKNYFTYSSPNALVWIVNLPASSKFEFGIVKVDASTSGETWYGNSWHIDETTDATDLADNDWTFGTSGGNCTLNTGAEGTYVFTIDATHLSGENPGPRLRVYYPGDAPKVFLERNKYIYLDGTAGVWQGAEYKARFWFKATTEDVHTSEIECLYDNNLDVNYMYYTKVPVDYIDRVQVNRINPGNTTYYAQLKHGFKRDNDKQNCLVLDASGNWGSGGNDLANLSWGTYCPPMSSATIIHDAEHTKTYGGNGESSTPFIIAASSNICVSATSVSKLDDENMKPHYKFIKNSSDDGDFSAASTHTFTTTSTNNANYTVTLLAKNYYNSTYGTESSTNNTIYYQARTGYSVTHTRGHVTTASGDEGSNAAVNNVEYTASFTADPGYALPDNVTVTRNGTDITANCTWDQESGTLTIPDAQVTNNITITVTGQKPVFHDGDGDGLWSNPDNWTPAAVPTSSQDATILSGKTAKITAAAQARNLTVQSGATLNVNTTNGDGTGSGITLSVYSLSLEGGWTRIDDEDVYDMPRVYIDSKSTLTKTINIVNFDVAVDAGNYYPIAVPFPVTVGDDPGDVDFRDYYPYSTYGLTGQYVFKKYNGATRAANGAVSYCWEVVDEGETLEPGIGYIMTALPALYDSYAIIRFPMTVDDAWTAGGEKGSATISASTVTKNQVTVTAHVKDKGDTPKANKGWNLLGVPYMACYQTGTDMYSGGTASIIQGRFDYSTNTWKEEEVRYVTVPTHDFSEYHQYDITDGDTKLLPEWCFFIQAETSGTLTFAADDRTNSGLIYAPKREQASMPTVKTGIILSGADASDKTTFLVSDKYDGSEYEINADLEKMFGENSYTLATYSLMGSTRLAYNAMSNADALNIIPIGYRAPEDGDYTFSINPRYAENFAQVNLIDYQTNTITDLLVDDYTFNSERTQNDARFALNVVPKSQMPTDVEIIAGDGLKDVDVRKVLINNQLYIIRDGRMYDAQGALIK